MQLFGERTARGVRIYNLDQAVEIVMEGEEVRLVFPHRTVDLKPESIGAFKQFWAARCATSVFGPAREAAP
jgi:hypothetical protein